MDADLRSAVSTSHLRELPGEVLDALLVGSARMRISAGSVTHWEGEPDPHLELVVSGPPARLSNGWIGSPAPARCARACGWPSWAADGDGWSLLTSDGELRARAVVVASGGENLPRIPGLAGALPGRVAQLHAADYRNPGQLPDGAVLLVGSAQSGCQIAQDLLAGGRQMILATSPVGRAPARHRGRDTVEWLFECGFFDQRPEDLPDPR